MARAAIALYEITGHQPYLDKAVLWTKTLNEKFWRSDIGGYTLTPADGEALIVRVRSAMDGATPSVNGTMMHVLVRLNALTGDVAYAERFSTIAQVFGDDARRQIASAATLYNGFDFVLRAQQVVIIGQRNEAGVNAFREVFRRLSAPNKIVTVVAPGEALRPNHPAQGKGQVNNRPTVYFCAGETCSAPITDPVQFESFLKIRVVNDGPASQRFG
jgi:uncharacterized protein YyaL (SSP411 family)